MRTGSDQTYLIAGLNYLISSINFFMLDPSTKLGKTKFFKSSFPKPTFVSFTTLSSSYKTDASASKANFSASSLFHFHSIFLTSTLSFSFIYSSVFSSSSLTLAPCIVPTAHTTTSITL